MIYSDHCEAWCGKIDFSGLLLRVLLSFIIIKAFHCGIGVQCETTQ